MLAGVQVQTRSDVECLLMLSGGSQIIKLVV